jgi:hypothetical protein
MGKLITGLIKADLIGFITPALMLELAVIQQNIHASHSVISNDDLEGICLAKLQ